MSTVETITVSSRALLSPLHTTPLGVSTPNSNTSLQIDNIAPGDLAANVAWKSEATGFVSGWIPVLAVLFVVWMVSK